MRSFSRAVLYLWLRLATIAEIGVLLAYVPTLVSISGGWPVLLTPPEIAFESVIYLLSVALATALFAAGCAVLLSPLLWRASSREKIAAIIVRTAVAIAAFIDFRILLASLLVHSHLSVRQTSLIFALYYLAFAAALIIPKQRKQLTGSLDAFLEEKTTRRAAIGLAAATVAVIGTERVTRAAVTRRAPLPAKRPERNVLLISFDALAADDMSLYGYRLPTTPRIEEFARKSSVFTNFFSASTFTTPGIASILTGLYPSEHGVYHIPGRFDSRRARMTLPHLMREAGFATGASIANPYAHFLNQDIAGDYDIFPDMPYHVRDLRKAWNGTSILHQQGSIGNRAVEFVDFKHGFELLPNLAEERYPKRFARLSSPFPPEQSFAQGLEILDRLPQGFFLWIHVMAPHGPYLPDPAHVGRFLSTGEMRTEMAQISFTPATSYTPAQQPLVDKARLRYDEFVSEADEAFGRFISQAETAGRLRNTAVVVTADHGESFEGGVYSHKSRFLTRPQIHIPLVIRMPGQQEGRQLSSPADQTSIAPTILEAAGLSKASWMRGRSLVGELNGASSVTEPASAFTQYFETDSTMKPLRKGTVGIIRDGEQYIVDLPTGKGFLRSLSEAQSKDCDHSAENPERAAELRSAIHTRFPEVPIGKV
jgi:arylsulfatase A-like enzyme